MPKHFIIKNNGYWNEGWWERCPDGKRRLKKLPLYDFNGDPIKGDGRRDDAVIAIHNKNNHKNAILPPNETVDSFMPKFIKYLEDLGRKKATLKTYEYDVNDAKKHLPLYIKDVAGPHINTYLNAISVSTKTKIRRVKSLSRFFKVGMRLGVIQRSPIGGFEFPKSKTIVNPYSEEDILTLIQTAKELEEQFGEPYYTLIMLAFQMGLRLDEYVNLRWKYFDMTNKTYTICMDDTWRPKHDVKRILKVPKLSYELLMKLPRKEGCDYIFNKNGRRHHHFTRDFSNNIFKAAGVERVGLHQIRKTMASYKLACGQPPQNLQYYLGHSSLGEIVAYIGIVSNPSPKMLEIFGDY